MIQTISNFRVFRDSLLLFACLGGTVSLPYGGNTSATRGGTRRSQPQKIVQIIPIFNYGRCLTSFKNLSVLAIQQTEMEQYSQNCHRLHQFQVLGLVTRLLGARLAASVGIKLLPKVPVTEGVNEKQIPVHISRANMQLQDGLARLGGNSKSGATCISNPKSYTASLVCQNRPVTHHLSRQETPNSMEGRKSMLKA
jgi:hypothetical protein